MAVFIVLETQGLTLTDPATYVGQELSRLSGERVDTIKYKYP